MKPFLAFTRKELLAQFRTGKVTILGILFVLFGIMNPAIAKLTPWLMEMMADSLAESGMIITDITVTANTHSMPKTPKRAAAKIDASLK